MTQPRTDRATITPQIAEVFREHGYEGASLALIEAATSLGKGSLYHFFPRGKEQMAAEVLADIAQWFEVHLFAALSEASDPAAAIDAMFDTVLAYFQSGRRVCLVGVVALADARDRFAADVRAYFVRWIDTLAQALARIGWTGDEAVGMAEEIVEGLQGAIVLSRALDDAAVFGRAVERFRTRLGILGPQA